MKFKDPLNPDLDEIIKYASWKSGKSMYDIMVMEQSAYINFLHKYEQEIIRKALENVEQD